MRCIPMTQCLSVLKWCTIAFFRGSIGLARSGGWVYQLECEFVDQLAPFKVKAQSHSKCLKTLLHESRRAYSDNSLGPGRGAIYEASADITAKRLLISAMC